MKRITSIFLLIILAGNAFSQQTNKHQKLTREEYLQKSGDQLLLGSLLLGGCTALIFIGANTQKNATGFDFTGIGVEGLGVIAVGGSIPLFIGAIYNHRKGKGISANIKLENSLSLQQLKVSCHSFPAVSVKINL